MSDLIDLNSPDVKRLINSKLSSPLIPVPRNIESNEQTSSLMEKRESLGSNPFDSVLYETADYVRKKGDPFEVMLQRALKCKSNKITNLEAQSVTFTDDFTPKCRKKFLKMMNKTLDESLIKDKTGIIGREKKEGTVSLVASNASVCDSNTAKEKNSSSTEFILPTSSTLKPYLGLFQRSLSQGDKKSPRKFQSLHKRILSTSKIASHSDSTVLSSLHKSYLESKQSQWSVFSDLSDVSSTARLNSISPVSSVLSASSSGIVNQAILDNDFVKMNSDRANTAGNSMEKSIPYDLSNLTERHTLNYTIDTTSALNFKKETDQSNFIKGKDGEQTMDDKLIDVDVSMGESSSNKEHNSTTSTSSLDSVFIANSKVDKLILNEAKELSRIFGELTVRTNSVSYTDDLISNDTQWMSELQPAFEDEIEDDLIELLVSPKKHLKDDKNNDLTQSPANIDATGKTLMKEIESQFIDCVSTVNQTMATTLLLDLKKLVKTENNPAASKLIDNLESVLGIKYKNNTELLASLNMSNELRTFEMADDKCDNIEQLSKTSINKSQEENRKESCEKNVCDSESSVSHISYKLGDTVQATTVSDNSSAKTSPCDNNEDHLNILVSSKTALNTNSSSDKDSHSDEQLAVELLVNFGKLLSGQAEDATTLRLLKNIEKALNIASNNSEIEDASQTNDKSDNTRRIIPLETSESECNASLSSSKETTYKQSFKFKPLERTKKNISVIHSSNANTSNTQVNVKRKSTFELKNQKRLSSNPGLISAVTNKKNSISRASSTRTAETAELDNKKEKQLAIIDVRNKLKKKSDVVGKRGPMKAMHPVGTMQKKVSLGKQTASSSQITTPPKSNTIASSFGSKIISSTPNSMTSSTPDNQRDGISKTPLKFTNKKRNLSCDISPVSSQKGGSPKRSIQSSPSKICTPTRRRANSSSIPRYSTPPRKLNSSLDISRRQRSPQYLNKSLTSYQQYSLIKNSKNVEKRLQNPLQESNKLFGNVKPFKLISKLKENTTSDFTEGKENCTE